MRIETVAWWCEVASVERYDELIKLATALGYWDDVEHWQAAKAELIEKEYERNQS